MPRHPLEAHAELPPDEQHLQTGEEPAHVRDGCGEPCVEGTPLVGRREEGTMQRGDQAEEDAQEGAADDGGVDCGGCKVEMS